MADQTVERLLRDNPPQVALEWVVNTVGANARVVGVSPLFGGVSHATHRIDIDQSGRNRSVVLRRWVRPDWQEDNASYSAMHEAETLELLQLGGVQAPRLIGVDNDARHCDVPAVIASLVEGDQPAITSERSGVLATEFARAIALVHALPQGEARRVSVPYVRYYTADELDVPQWSSQAELWKRAISVFTKEPPITYEGFIHRDYHPGNTLWVGDVLSGILDWERGSWGPIAIDLAHMRVNLARMGYPEIAHDYTQKYCAMTGRDMRELAYWDVVDAVDLMPEMHSATSEQQRNLEGFVAAGLDRLL